MGTDFTAVVNHNLGAEHIYTLPDLLNSTWHEIHHLLPILNGYPAPGIPRTKWHWREFDNISLHDRLHDHGTIRIVSYEFSGFVSNRVFQICHGVRWWSFLTDDEIRDKLIGVCHHIASLLGSNQIIYLPDGFYKPEGALGLLYEGKGVEEMIDWLYTNCGPPAQSIELIYQEDAQGWNGNGYYVDVLQEARS